MALNDFLTSFVTGLGFGLAFVFIVRREELRDFSMRGEKERVTFAAQVWRRCRSLP